MLPAYLLLVRAGFQRHSTYFLATLGGLFTNTVFGLLRVAVLLTVAAEAGRATGYDAATSSTFVWLGQGLIAVVQIWSTGELAERVRSGDVAIDLSRPWNLLAAQLAQDVGRAGHATLFRFVPPLAFGALLLPFRWPQRWETLLVFVVSVLLAVVISSALRFLLDLAAFWLIDTRGLRGVYNSVGGTMGGLTVPLAFFPDGVRWLLYATPFPAMLQTPIDVFTERGPTLLLLAHQLLWAVGLVVIGQVALARATRKLVVQGG